MVIKNTATTLKIEKKTPDKLTPTENYNKSTTKIYISENIKYEKHENMLFLN